jgi:hypothetical protein
MRVIFSAMKKEGLEPSDSGSSAEKKQALIVVVSGGQVYKDSSREVL